MVKTEKKPSADAPRRASYQDVLDAPQHLVAEIIDGVLHTHPRPALVHAYAHTSLGSALTQTYGRGGGNGAGGWLILFEPELHLGKDIVVPDLAGWRRERMSAPPAAAYFTLVPDWVCEILSPSTRALDQVAKMDLYAREAVGHLWFVDPEARTLAVHALRDGRWRLVESVQGEAEVAPPPFSAAPFKLGDLWWAAPAPSEPSRVHEPAAPQSPASP